MQACALHPTAEPRSTSRRSHLASKETAIMVRPDAPPWCDPALETERILMVDFAPT
jgi:hypothetical protein